MLRRPALCLAAAVALSACGDDGILPHPVPVALTHPLKVGELVVCEETLFRVGVPNFFPIIQWARRTFTCELVPKARPIAGK